LEYLEDSNKFEEIYSNLPSISIDYGIMEKSSMLKLFRVIFTGMILEAGYPFMILKKRILWEMLLSGNSN